MAINETHVVQLLIKEARLLDERQFEEWESLFSDDGFYWVPTRPEQESPHSEVSIFYDDRELMRRRIERLHHPRIHVDIPPRRTVHLIANIECTANPANGIDWMVASNFIMTEYRQGSVRIFSGRYQHKLKVVGGELKIALKRVDLINCDDVFEPIVAII